MSTLHSPSQHSISYLSGPITPTPFIPSPTVNTNLPITPRSGTHGTNWKSQIIGQLHARNAKQTKAFGDIFGAYSRLLASHRAVKNRAFQLEQEVMTTRQLSSLAATPGLLHRPDITGVGSGTIGANGAGSGGGGGLGAATQKLLEEKILKLQEDLTSAYRLQSENSNTFLRLKDQAEKDEKALLKKEEELAEKTRQLITLQHTLQTERDAARDRHKSLESTIELLRGEVQGSRNQAKALEAKLAQLTQENDVLVTRIIKLNEEKNNEQTELEVVRQELLKAQAEKKAIADQQQQRTSAIAPTEVDLSDMNSLIDHVAWTSNCHVVVPNDRKRTIRGHRGPITCIRYNTAGTLFASAGTDGLLKIYDARSGANRATLRATKESVMNLGFSRDDSMMVASGNDSISRIWSLKSSRVLHTLVGHSNKIWASTFTSDGSAVVTGSHDRTVKIWNVDDGACKKSILCQSSCNYLAISKNDNILATAHLDTNVRFWNAKTGELMHVMEDIHNGQATSVEFNRDDSLVVTCSRDNTVKVTDMRTYRVLQVFEGTSKHPFRNLINWNRAIWSPDSAWICAGGHSGELFFWNLDSGRLSSVLPGVSMGEGIYGTPTTSAPSPLSSSLPSSFSGSSSMAAVAAANAISEQAISCVDWCRNGRQVMSCDQGGNIHVWEHDTALTAPK